MLRDRALLAIALTFLTAPLLACSGRSPDKSLPTQGTTGADGGPGAVNATVRVATAGTPTTAENGKRATFTVALSTRPVADVVVPVQTSNPAEIKAEPTSVSFGPDDWDKPKTVTLIGQDDQIADGDRRVIVALGPTHSADTAYSGVKVDPFEAVNEDDDIAAVEVSTPTPSNNTTETGGEATFTVKLKSRPMSDVSIGVSSSILTEGKPDKTLLVFGTETWQTPQTVKITGQNDSVADDDKAFDIVLAKPKSNDVAYAALGETKLPFLNLDDDIPGFFVFPPAIQDRTTSEGGTTTSFGVRLRSKPAADVTIPVSSSKATEGQPAVSELVFSPTNYDQLQTIIVTGQDDFLDDGDQSYAIVLGEAVSADAGYAGLNPPDVDLTNVDDDAAAILVGTPMPNSLTSEAGGAVTFTVKLASQPTDTVTIAVSSSKEAEGVADVAQLTFDAADWSQEKTVTVTGKDDVVDDGSQAYAIVLAKAASNDAKYAAIDPADVALTNTDDDTAGITVSQPSPSNQTTEGGAKVTVTVVLQTQPTADVTIPVSVDMTAEATVSTGLLTFTTANWDTPQTITVEGKNDDVDDGDVSYELVLGAASGGGYGGIDPANVALTNVDDDTAGIVVSAISGMQTNEIDGAVSFTIVLASRPAGTATVAIPIASSKPTEAEPDKATVTFTIANWNVPQTVTISGKNDGVVDDDQTFDITLGAATSGDAKYAAIDPADFTGLVNVSACGIGGVNAGEQCDDGNALMCDGCERCQRRFVATIAAAASASVAGVAAVLPSGTMCVEAWTKTSADAVIAASSAADTDSAFSLRCEAGAAVFSSQTSAETITASGGSGCSDGTWHHVAGCREVVAAVVTNTVYLDGALVGTSAAGTVAGVGAPAAMTLGGTAAIDIDEVRISKTLRSAAVRRHVSDADTVGLWHLDEGTGTTFADAAPAPHAGTHPGAGWATDTGYVASMCQ